MANDEVKRQLDEAQEELAIHRVMVRHVNASNPIGMGELYAKVYGKPWAHRINDTRKIRKAITRMRRGGCPIVSVVSPSGGGYYMAAVNSELEEYCARQEMRAKKILKRISVLRGKPMQELLGQMIADCTEGEDA